MAEELIPVGYKLVVLTLDFSESFKERAMAVQKSEKEKNYKNYKQINYT